MMFARWAAEFQGHTNQLPLFDQQRSDAVGGDPNIRYYHSYWRLAADEALLIEAQPPECATWNFQLNNHWMESLDYRHRRVHVNKFTARYGAAGAVRIVVAAAPPADAAGDCNWIDTCGHRCGTMCFRWVQPRLPPGEPLPHPRPSVVPLASLH